MAFAVRTLVSLDTTRVDTLVDRLPRCTVTTWATDLFFAFNTFSQPGRRVLLAGQGLPFLVGILPGLHADRKPLLKALYYLQIINNNINKVKNEGAPNEQRASSQRW